MSNDWTATGKALAMTVNEENSGRLKSTLLILFIFEKTIAKIDTSAKASV